MGPDESPPTASPACRAHCGSQADRQTAVGGSGPSRVLDQRATRGGERAQERHRIGADQRIFGDAKTVQN